MSKLQTEKYSIVQSTVNSELEVATDLGVISRLQLGCSPVSFYIVLYSNLPFVSFHTNLAFCHVFIEF